MDTVRVWYVDYTGSGENNNLWFSMGFYTPLYTLIGSYYTHGVAPSSQSFVVVYRRPLDFPFSVIHVDRVILYAWSSPF